MKPNKKNIRKWVERLESGKVKQTTRMLARKRNKSYSYCCLGVACELAVKNGVKISREKTRYGLSYDCRSHSLPQVVSDWLGIDYDAEAELVTMNDIESLSFKEIAEFLRKRYNLRNRSV